MNVLSRPAALSGLVCELLGLSRRVFALVVALLLLCPLCTAHLAAQSVGGTIAGTVKESSGAVLPEATAVVTNTKTGVKTTVKTNGQGLYRVANLQPGTYELLISLDGFSNGLNKNITVTPGGENTIDFTLQVASVDQQITVTGAEAAVDLQTSTLSYDVPGTAVRELPLNGRDFTALATLLPGVSQINGAAQGTARTGFGRAISISGQRPASNNYLEDGISLNDQANNTPGSVIGVTLGVDAIDQFTILTDTFPAEYGNASGGIFNAVTKSGTDQFHGNIFYFGRNSAIDAHAYFDNSVKNHTPQPAFRRHQYGGSIGGPIKKDKAFFFANFEAINQLKGSPQTNTIPSATFWANAETNIKRLQKLYPTPSSTALCTGLTCSDSSVVTDFVGNEYYTLGKVDYKFNEKNSIAGSYFLDYGSIKQPDAFKNYEQQQLTHRQGVAMEYTRTISPSMVNIARFGFTRSLYQGPKITQIFNSAITDTSLGYVPGKEIGAISVSGLTSLAAGPTGLDYSFAAFNSFQGYDSFLLTKGKHAFKFGAMVDRMQYNSSQPNLSGGSYTWGSLTGFQQNGKIVAGLNAAVPSLTYAVQLDPFIFYAKGNPAAPNGGYVGGDNQTYPGDDERGMRLTMMGFYAQDDWRLASNFTVNYGIRYEPTTEPNVVHGKTALVEFLTDPAPRIGGPIDDKNPTLKNIAPRVGFSWDPFRKGLTAVRGGFGFYDNLMLLNEYDTPLFRSYPFFAQAVITSPAGSTVCTGKDFTTNPPTYTPTGCIPTYGTEGTADQQGYKVASTASAALRTAYADPAPPRSYTMQWNLNLEQQFAGGWQLTLGYVGARGVHLLQVERNINSVTPTKTASGYFYPAVLASSPAIKINPNYSAINTSATWNTDSIYHALHVSVKRNLSKGLQVQGSYAWGKSLDTASSTGSTTSGSGYPYGIGNPYPLYPAINRGPSDFDLRHNATISAVYTAPDPHFGNKLIEISTAGWELAGIYRVQTGLPFTVLLSSDESYLDPVHPTVSYRGETETDTTTNSLGERPNYVPGCKITNPGNLHYINSGCFSFPSRTDTLNHVAGATPGTYLGNLSRNSASAPGFQKADISLLKNNRIANRIDMQLRFEFFNIANHPNFTLNSNSTAPYVIYSSAGAVNGTFGTITQTVDQSTTGNERQIQYGVKLTF